MALSSNLVRISGFQPEDTGSNPVRVANFGGEEKVIMTWKEFKDYVDSQIEDEDVEIFYIDISYPSLDHKMSKPYINIENKPNGSTEMSIH